MAISSPRLRLSRHGVFVFRLILPAQFREFFGKTELRRSLRTKDAATARLIALHLNAQIEMALKCLTPAQACNWIKKTMDHNVFGWRLVVKKNGDTELITDGTPEDADSAAYHASRGLKPLLQGGKNAEPKIELEPVRHHDHPEKPLRISEAIATFLSEYESSMLNHNQN